MNNLCINSLFKEIYSNKLKDLIPQGVSLFKLREYWFESKNNKLIYNKKDRLNILILELV